MKLLDPATLLSTSVLELRGDGKAGGGLVLAFQSLATLFLNQGCHVQEWPFFSSARRGANIRSFLRLSRHPIDKACEVSRPAVSVLMDEGAARAVDFALGVAEGGTFVLNTRHSPEECARHYRLTGRVLTVPGDEIGTKYLRHPIGNVSVYVACARAIGDLPAQDVAASFLQALERRHVPESILARNRDALAATAEHVREGVFDEGKGAARTQPKAAALALPVGGQTPLRLSRSNRTANFAPSGFRLRFSDPDDACNGCAHCITNCPEGIIRWQPDEANGVKVSGADVSTFCKLCGECVAVCPEHLFTQAPFEEHWEEEVPAS